MVAHSTSSNDQIKLISKFVVSDPFFFSNIQVAINLSSLRSLQLACAYTVESD